MSDTAPKESSSAQSAYLRLLGELRAGTIGPGERVTETDLAKRLQISRTPVREAIRKLESEGLVEHIPRVGATIRRLGYSEIMELYEMRAVLESTAARMAARAASDIELSELAALNDELAAVTDNPGEVYALNRQFHLTLLDAAKNRFLIKAMAGLQKTLLLLGPLIFTQPNRVEASVVEHQNVLEALNARDEAGAEQAMRAHVEAAHRGRLRQLRAARLLEPQDSDIIP